MIASATIISVPEAVSFASTSARSESSPERKDLSRAAWRVRLVCINALDRERALTMLVTSSNPDCSLYATLS